MAKTERNSRIKRDRRAIIAALRMIYPGSMEGEELFRIVLDANPEYTRVFLVRDCTYLNEKDYVKFRGNAGIDVMRISVQHCQFSLTAKGTDVADQLIEDPTLDI